MTSEQRGRARLPEERVLKQRPESRERRSPDRTRENVPGKGVTNTKVLGGDTSGMPEDSKDGQCSARAVSDGERSSVRPARWTRDRWPRARLGARFLLSAPPRGRLFC